MLHDIDTGRDLLAVQQPPNDGTLKVIGRLGVNVAGARGFDIAADGAAWAALSLAASGGTRTYAIDLPSGKARLLGKLGRGSTLAGLAFAPRPVAR